MGGPDKSRWKPESAASQYRHAVGVIRVAAQIIVWIMTEAGKLARLIAALRNRPKTPYAE
ncbi:MAG TPA: hypothetical protein DC058_22125 [Planctomycetaceae bacterium]|nr:hypothetical protein [Planctomycetaceae bacterium]HBC63899.1 hypothetical protein [Planctomycetaceae bacterium]